MLYSYVRTRLPMESLKNLFSVSDLRNRVLFTLGLLGVYRLGNHIPTPGVNTAALQELARQAQNTMFGLYDMFSGGNLSKVTIFALGIMPYISASIILQLLTVVWPYLERLSKEGELGRRKITQYTRYGTVALCLVQALGIAVFLERNTSPSGFHLVMNPGWGFRLMTVLTLSTGTSFIMWLGEQITERGIGNGMSLHNLLYILGIIFFAYFYTAIIFNPDDVAENMRKYGGFIPGIRPGKRTAEYIDTILTRITLAGAIYLALIAILPQWLTGGFRVAPIPFIGERLDAILPKFITEGMNVTFFFGGTSLLIVVGVTMDTVQQVESQLIMRHYDGFMKKTRLRGRRG